MPFSFYFGRGVGCVRDESISSGMAGLIVTEVQTHSLQHQCCLLASMEPRHAKALVFRDTKGTTNAIIFVMFTVSAPITNKKMKSQRRRKGGPKKHPGGEQKEGTEASQQMKGR